MEIITSSGRALAESDVAERPEFLLVLTHGAGGGVGSKDILAARRAGLEAGAVVVRVTQPYRAGGARAPGSAQRQDQAWLEITSALRAAHPGLPLVQGGRSNGARVACRTARQAGAAGAGPAGTGTALLLSPTAELRLMDVVWEKGKATVSEVVESLPKDVPLAYSTVLTTLRILENKGYLRHTKESRSFVYHPVVRKEEARESALTHLLRRFFEDSPELLVLNLVERRKIGARELARLRKKIEEERS